MSKGHQQESHWVALSDLMTALMIIFLLIAVANMMDLQIKQNETENAIKAYEQIKADVNKALHQKFDHKLKEWGAYIDGERIIFHDPRILFNEGSSQIKPQFETILQEFFPDYVDLITSPQFINTIEEIRIEGHTDSKSFYLYNMGLSQERSLNTLKFVVREYEKLANQNLGNANRTKLDWLIANLMANGWSFSKLICNDVKEKSPCAKSGENAELSRRVEFKIKTNAERQMQLILDRFTNHIKENNTSKLNHK